MKFILFASLITFYGSLASAEGERSSPSIDCCHTGLCKTDIPLCPGVSRKAERRESSGKRPGRGKGAAGARAVGE